MNNAQQLLETKKRHQQELQDLLDRQHEEAFLVMQGGKLTTATGWVYDPTTRTIEAKQVAVPAEWHVTGSTQSDADNYTRLTGVVAYSTIEAAWKVYGKVAEPREDWDFFRFFDGMVEDCGCQELTYYVYEPEGKLITASTIWVATYVPLQAILDKVKGYATFNDAQFNRLNQGGK